MDIPGIPDRKVVAECAAWKPVNFCGLPWRLAGTPVRNCYGLAVPRTTGEFDESGFEFALVDCLAGKWGWIAWPASA